MNASISIYRQQKKGDIIYLKLRKKRKNKRKRLKKDDNRGKIPNRVMIDKRPEIINNKERIGDWEGDTIIGKDHKSAMFTLVERKSKFTFIFPLNAKKANEIEQKMTNSFKQTTIPITSLTFGNGHDFTNHENISTQLKCPIFFAFPYHSWERGLNENTNGLIRQYFPKKSDFNEFENDFVVEV